MQMFFKPQSKHVEKTKQNKSPQNKTNHFANKSSNQGFTPQQWHKSIHKLKFNLSSELQCNLVFILNNVYSTHRKDQKDLSRLISNLLCMKCLPLNVIILFSIFLHAQCISSAGFCKELLFLIVPLSSTIGEIFVHGLSMSAQLII